MVRLVSPDLPPGGSADGTGPAASFYYPAGVAFSAGVPSRLVVVDSVYHMIRMIR